MIESHRLEYKRELSDTLEKDVVAFLNSKEGGLIYIGIDPKTGKPCGLADADQIQLQVKDRLINNIAPSILGLFDIHLEKSTDDLPVIKIILASGAEKPYHIKRYGMSSKGCYIRIGSASQPMSQQMIEELFIKRVRKTIGNVRSSRQDLNFEQLKIFYDEHSLKLTDKFAPNLELFTPEGDYNYAAYLLADNNTVSIKVAKYNGLDRVDLIENNEYGFCCLIKACKQVLDKLDLENKTATQITPKERIDTPLLNRIALREAVINAIVHNDYSYEVPPKFELFSNRLEITSAGGLPQELSKGEFFQGLSVPRNRELMRVFRDVKLVEYLGSGMPRILKAYSSESFEFTENFLRISFLYKSRASEEMSNNSNELRTFRGDLSEEMSEEIDAQLLSNIATNQGVTIRELAESLRITTRTVERHISKLKDEGRLVRIGATKGGKWKIVK